MLSDSSDDDDDDDEGVTPCDRYCRKCPCHMSPPLLNCCLRIGLPCCVSIILSIGAFWLAMSRNYGCVPSALEGIEAAFGGELLPQNVTLKERINKWGMQFTKLVDVYDAHGSHLGYFYDMNFLMFMRFGFSDASDRIWFEAKRPWFMGATSFNQWWNRAFWYGSEHLYLTRCDHGTVQNNRLNGVYLIDEDTTVRPWWCKEQCMKILDVKLSGGHAGAPTSLARVHFNYTLEWYYGGFKTRAAWNMLMTDPQTGTTVATAHQYFGLQDYALQWKGLPQRYVSRWSIDTLVEEPLLPNWVIVFMAVLDDIDEGGGHAQQSDD